MKLFFIVGESSGDALGAPLIKEFKNQYGDDAICMGVGGPKMKQAGCDILLPYDQISVIGLWEVLPKIPQLLKINKAIIEEIEKQQPDAVITIDFPDFNFILAKKLKRRGVYKGKVIHYVSPSVWAWRSGRAKKISKFLDGIMCLFPMEPEYYTKHGLRAEHIGHPLVSTAAKSADGQGFRTDNKIPENNKTLGLFLGSRVSEFKRMGTTIEASAEIIHEANNKKISIISPTLEKIEGDIQQILSNCPIPVHVTADQSIKWEAFKACDVAVAVSGTVALELSYAGVPHVIAYKVNTITSLILRMMIKVKHVHLTNILLKRGVVPECLQGRCTPQTIAAEVQELLNNPKKRQEQIDAFKELGDLLGAAYDDTPAERAVKFIENTIKS